MLWVEKYRPRTIDETILPKDLKVTLQTFVDKGEVPNLLLTGRPGVGKTTVARALLEQCGFDSYIINGSLDGNIDTLRRDIKNFAATVSLTGSRKFVILDEADYLNPQSTQPALRNFMEEYSGNCGFILTCNYKNKIIDPLHSRCSVVDFVIDKKAAPILAGQFLKRICGILDEETVEYDKKAIVELITNYFPDWRRILNELQRYSVTGRIDLGILVSATDEMMKELMSFLKERDFKSMRKWVGQHSDVEVPVILRALYDMSDKYVEEKSIPQLIVTLADYQYKAAFVADGELNLTACLTEVMSECQFR